MVLVTGSITAIFMRSILPGRARDAPLRAVAVVRFWKLSVPRSLCKSRSARSAPIFRSVHWLGYALGEAGRIT
jgi:hypothetical protein